jgi:menaquinone-9 beta-reductase
VREARTLVIGGGPAGAAAACLLAAGGMPVTLVERRTAPAGVVCGEFVGPAAGAELDHLLGDAATGLGGAAIDRLAVSYRRHQAHARLPFRAQGVARERLEQALLARARANGALLLQGSTVRRLEPRARGWQATLADGRRIEADRVLLATGKHELRGHRRRAPAAAPLVAFKTRLKLTATARAALERHIHLFWFGGGYAGLQSVGEGAASLCLVVPTAAHRAWGNAWPATLGALRREAPLLDGLLDGADDLWEQPASIANIPYGYLCHQGIDPPGLYRIGDQLAVIASFAGEGIGIALRSGRLAAEAVLRGEDAASYRRRALAAVSGAVRIGGAIDGLGRRPRLLPAAVAAARLPGVLPLLARSLRIG